MDLNVLNKKIRNTLSSYGKLASPQVNTFHSEDIYAYPPNFSFRFEDKDLNRLYKELAEAVNLFRGKLRWVMHSYGSRKNHTIEPIDFFNARKIVDGQEDSTVKSILKEEYEDLCEKAVSDILPLCEFILSQVKGK